MQDACSKRSMVQARIGLEPTGRYCLATAPGRREPAPAAVQPAFGAAGAYAAPQSMQASPSPAQGPTAPGGFLPNNAVVGGGMTQPYPGMAAANDPSTMPPQQAQVPQQLQ